MTKVIDLTAPENLLTAELMDCFLKVHKAMGPGLLESIYEECICHDLKKRGIAFEQQKPIVLNFDGDILKTKLRLDLVIETKIIIELKSVEALLPVHKAQIISYLKLSKLPIGFLVNFNVPLIKSGVQRFVNEF